ncbi:MAG: pantetheine-phosphate adenylyltransferase [Halobacteriovoraceae bacterium]|nr:pantetheine-phosphate adenylyltransferase [Halobacteriovoraceae bacterium]
MNKHRRAIYAGTFDPFTNGHKSILERSLKIIDEVTILVAKSPTKKPLFSPQKRVEMISKVFENDKRIRVDSWDGLVIEYARQENIGTIIRGLRPTGDFEVEFQMASMNKKLFYDVETIFLMTGGEHYFVSSTLVKEIYTYGGNICEFVPPEIFEYLKDEKRI